MNVAFLLLSLSGGWWPIYMPSDNPAKGWAGIKTVVRGSPLWPVNLCGQAWLQKGWMKCLQSYLHNTLTLYVHWALQIDRLNTVSHTEFLLFLKYLYTHYCGKYNTYLSVIITKWITVLLPSCVFSTAIKWCLRNVLSRRSILWLKNSFPGVIQDLMSSV